MSTVLLVLAVWFAVGAPVALLLGRVIEGRDAQVPNDAEPTQRSVS